jgi:hypothetical protein
LKLKICGALFAAASLCVLPVSAHHSTSAEFDMTKKMQVSGTLIKVDWVNPHIGVDVEAKGADGKVEAWHFESSPPAWFKRVGIARADFTKYLGQKVDIEGVRAKNGALFGYLQKVTFAGGVTLELGVNGADGK